MTRTFAVSPVDAVRSALPALDLSTSLTERGLGRIESSGSSRPLVRVPAMHGVLGAIHLAFAEHRPLALSPDHVWLCITQAVARHIVGNAESLRRRFVDHDGQKALEVRRDDFRPGDPSNDWPGAIAELSSLLHRHLGDDSHGMFVASSSTTDAVARTASEVVLMGAMQRYFTYTVATMCGIPELTLEGTTDDWRVLRRRIDRFQGIGLDDWLRALGPFLDQLVRASAGDPSETFFRQLYKAEDASGGTYVSGFVNVLFPFLGDAGIEGASVNRLASEVTPQKRHALECPKLDAYPSGLASTPFTWRFLVGEQPMSLVAGFVGVSQDAQTGVIRPELGWAVTPRVIDREFTLTEGNPGIPRALPKNAKSVPSFAALARETADLPAFALTLWFNECIESLEGLLEVPNLAELTVLGVPRLRSLAGLAGHPGLRKLMVQQCDSFEDADAIASLPALDDLMLAHLPRFTRFEPISRVPQLRVLGLFGGNVPASWVGKHEDPARIAQIVSEARR